MRASFFECLVTYDKLSWRFEARSIAGGKSDVNPICQHRLRQDSADVALKVGQVSGIRITWY